MRVSAPLGWRGTARQWDEQVTALEREYRALRADLRVHCREPASTQDEYVTRRVMELCRWNHWVVVCE